MDEFVKQSLEIVKAQAGIRPMTEEEMTSMVMKMSTSLKIASDVGSAAAGMDESSPDLQSDPRKVIKEKTITCLECGKNFKVLTKKHLASHDLTPDEYRGKYGYKKGTSLIAKGLSKARRKKMQEMELWKKRGSRLGK